MSASRILATAGLTAALLTSSAVGAVGAVGAATPAAAAAPVRAAAVHAAAPAVLVVRPGRQVPLGHGAWMTLTATERCVSDGGPANCKSVTDGNQPPGTVSLQTFGDSVRTLYSPLYIGAGRAARMTVEVAGSTYQARVVTLPGRPGYATGYAWGAPVQSSGGPADWPKVTVYDATGRVLAQL